MTADIRGSYDLIVDNTTFKLLIKGEIAAPESEIKILIQQSKLYNCPNFYGCPHHESQGC
jgi:hypothetical protein